MEFSKLAGLVLGASLICSTPCSGKEGHSIPQIYSDLLRLQKREERRMEEEEKKMLYVSRKIDKEYMKVSKSGLFNDSRYREENLKKVEEYENSKPYRSRIGKEAENSIMDIREAAFNNFNIIEKVRGIPYERMKEEYKPLKQLLLDLDKIYEDKKLSEAQKVENMYTVISDKIKTTKEPYTKGTLTMEKLVGGVGGDCNDIVSAYYAIYNYYNVETYFRIGVGKERINGKRLGHTWLHVGVGKKFINLDPTKYRKVFIPLEYQNPEDEWMYYVLEEYQKHKEDPKKTKEKDQEHKKDIGNLKITNL